MTRRYGSGAFRIGLDPIHAPRYARVRAERLIPPDAETNDPALLGTRLQIAFRFLKQRDKTSVDDPGRIALVENRKLNAAESRQPIDCRCPKVTIGASRIPYTEFCGNRSSAVQWSIRYCPLTAVIPKQRQKHSKNFFDKQVTIFKVPTKNQILWKVHLNLT